MAELTVRPGVARALLPQESEARRAKCMPAWKLATTASAATLLVATSLLAQVPRASGERVVARNSLGEEVTEVQSKACSEYPSLEFKMPKPILHSNLAKKGPDKGGGEGIVYDALVDPGRGAGHTLGRQHIHLVINATSSHYHPFSPELNGVQGEYGSINLQSGSSVDVRFRFYDRHSGARHRLLGAAFTFFDLGASCAGPSVQGVTLTKPFKHYHLTADTEVGVEDLGDRIRFSGGARGTAEDQLTDPTRHLQKHRAVTVTFEYLDELRATLEAGASVGPRFFTFAVRPSLVCGVLEGLTPLLGDIIAQPPLQWSVQSDCCESERFGTMLVSVGQDVKAGDGIFTVTRSDGSTKIYASPVHGKVTAVQSALVSGDDLMTRLANKTVAIVEEQLSEPLLSTRLPAIPLARRVGAGAEFSAVWGSSPEAGEDGAVAKKTGVRHDAARNGVKETQDGPQPGTSGTLEKGPAAVEKLPPSKLHTPAAGHRARTPWMLWRRDKAAVDPVKESDLAALVKQGVVAKRQEGSERGAVREVTQDEFLSASRLQPMALGEGGDAALSGRGFARLYHVAGAGRAAGEDILLATARDCEGNNSGTDECSTTEITRKWQLGQACGVVLLCCVFCRFYCLMNKPPPAYANMGELDGESESEPTASSSDEEGLRLDFEDAQKQIHTVYARWRPLGIKHSFTAPIVVRDFTANSYARQELGVQEGWKLTRVGDRELRESPDFKDVSLEVNTQMRDFPLWPLVLEFSPNLESRDRKPIKFLERPIGLIFKNTAPIQVEKIFQGSPAEDAGVEVGWLVTKIGDFEVTPTTSFTEAIGAFKEGVAALDDLGKRYRNSPTKMPKDRGSV